MTEETIVAVFQTDTHAEAAIRDLRQAGVPDAMISRHAGTDTVPGYGLPNRDTQAQGGFWSRLFGGEPDHDTAIYDRSLEHGATVVAIRAAEDHAAAIIDVLERHEPVDIDERATHYGTQLITPDVETLRLAEEQPPSKRLVNRGGARIRRFVSETSVDRVETIPDTVRRDDVEIENIDGDASATKRV